MALAFAAAVRKSPCSPPSVPSVLPWRGSGPLLTLVPSTSSPWGDAEGGELLCLHLQDLSALWSSPASAGALLLLPALVASQPSLSPAELLFHGARRGDTVHICRLFVLSPAPRGRTVCNGLFCFVLFSLCVCIHIFIYAYVETWIEIQAWVSQLSPSLPLTD